MPKAKSTKQKVVNNDDPFGEALWDFYNDGDGLMVDERDDGYVDIDSAGKYFENYKNWDKYEKKAIKYAKGSVLDIGCGAGRHALYLQKKKRDVLGIDTSALAIKLCLARGLNKALIMSIDEIGKFDPETFDSIVLMGSNWGLLGSLARGKELLKKMHKITKPKGRIIAVTQNPHLTKNKVHKDYHKLNRSRRRLPGQVKIRVRFGKQVTDWFDYLFVSQPELERMIKGTGWQVKKYLDSENSSYAVILTKA
jgi:SAM-dependent methyltransferase